MPPLVLFAVAGAGAYAGYRLFAKLIEQARTPSRADTERVRRDAAASAAARNQAARDLGELEWDEKAEVYRPKSG